MLVAGVDIIEIARVKRVAEEYGERFFRRIYTEGELAYSRGRAPQVRRQRGDYESSRHRSPGHPVEGH